MRERESVRLTRDPRESSKRFRQATKGRRLRRWLAERLAQPELTQARSEGEAKGRKVGYAEALDDPFGHDPDAHDPAHRLYRTNEESDKDYTGGSRARNRQLSIKAYHTKATAGHLIDLGLDFMVGEGLEPVPTGADKDDEVFADWLKDFWTDEINGFRERHPDQVATLHIDGEMGLTIERIDGDGKVAFGLLESYQIRDVEQDITRRDVRIKVHNPSAPDNPFTYVVLNQLEDEAKVGVMGPGEIIVQRPGPDGTYLKDEDGIPIGDIYDGAVFFAAVNRIAGARRGKPDLVPQLDYIDIQDDIIFRVGDRARMLAAAVYDVTVEGATDQQTIDKAIKELGLDKVPETLEALGHSERITLEIKNPDLGMDQIERLERILRLIIFGTRGYPEAFSGAGDDTNRSTLEKQNSVPARRLKRRQKLILDFYRLVIEFGIRQAIAAGVLIAKPEDKSYEFELMAPEIGSDDEKGMATALASLANAMTQAVGDKAMTLEAKNTVLVQALRKAGFELPEEIAGVDQERIEEGKATFEAGLGFGGGSSDDDGGGGKKDGDGDGQFQESYEDERDSAALRGYGHAWRKTRDDFLATAKGCITEGCKGKPTEVDHIRPLAKGGTNGPKNLQALCKGCHSKKTRAQEKRARAG